MNAVFQNVMDEPWGIGLGYRSASKISGGAKVTGIDNGYGDLCLTFGIFGAILIIAGLGMLLKELVAQSASVQSRELIVLKIQSLMTIVAIATGTLAILMLGGSSGMWLWLSIGLARAPMAATRASASEKMAL
ncbi:MAG: hypothetical protein QM754_00220 [Tepidisphaeraceae bacterium]